MQQDGKLQDLETKTKGIILETSEIMENYNIIIKIEELRG